MCKKKGEPAKAKERGKNISLWGGIALILNNLTGPGLVVLGASYQGGGWVSSSLVVIIVGILSILGCGMLARVMAHVRGNDHFQGSIEYTNICKAVFPTWLYYCIMIAFLLFFQFSNISQIVESAQVLDYLLLVVANKTCALELTPDVGLECIEYNPSIGLADSPFGSTQIVVSLGMILTLAISLPLGYVNLDDNIWFQYLSAVIMVIIWLEWCGQSIIDGQDLAKVAAFAANQYQVFGNILFNYAVVVSIPSWVNEKKPGVSINWTIWSTGVATILMYLTLGWLSACDVTLDYEATTGTDSVEILTLFSKKTTFILTKIMVYLFVITLVSGIPVWCIIIRYNLVQDGICSKPVANLFAVVFPFIVSVFFYSGSLLNEIVNIVGFLLCVPLNFIIPGYLYLLVLRQPGKPLCSVPGSDAQSAASLQNLSAHPSVKSVTAGDIEKSDESHKGCRSSTELSKSLLDDDVGYESQGSYCHHDHTLDLPHSDEPLDFPTPKYWVLPPAWTTKTKIFWAQAVIWVPTAMCVPAILLWVLETFTSYKG